jgi:hypothetical protein
LLWRDENYGPEGNPPSLSVTTTIPSASHKMKGCGVISIIKLNHLDIENQKFMKIIIEAKAKVAQYLDVKNGVKGFNSN